MDYFYSGLGQKAGASGAVGNDQIITGLNFAECAPCPGHVRVDGIDRSPFAAADGVPFGMAHLPYLQPKTKQDRPHCLLRFLVIAQGAWVVHGNPAMWNGRRGEIDFFFQPEFPRPSGRSVPDRTPGRSCNSWGRQQ